MNTKQATNVIVVADQTESIETQIISHVGILKDEKEPEMRALILRQIIERIGVSLCNGGHYKELHNATRWCHDMESLMVIPQKKKCNE